MTDDINIPILSEKLLLIGFMESFLQNEPIAWDWKRDLSSSFKRVRRRKFSKFIVYNLTQFANLRIDSLFLSSFDFAVSQLRSGRTEKRIPHPFVLSVGACAEVEWMSGRGKTRTLRSLSSGNPLDNDLRSFLPYFSKHILDHFTFTPQKKTKFELRFFWPAQCEPEIYDPFGLIFNKRDYTYKLTKDTYVLNDDGQNLKFRKGKLSLKKCIQCIDSICQFAKKEEIPLEENLVKLPTLEVLKKRYIRKMDQGTKIEIAIIKVHDQEWKSICIESKNLLNVLGLSLLVNKNQAQRLSYEMFLRSLR